MLCVATSRCNRLPPFHAALTEGSHHANSDQQTLGAIVAAGRRWLRQRGCVLSTEFKTCLYGNFSVPAEPLSLHAATQHLLRIHMTQTATSACFALSLPNLTTREGWLGTKHAVSNESSANDVFGAKLGQQPFDL